MKTIETSPKQKLGSFARLFGSYLVFNFRAGMEYRVSFFTQVFAMVLNNGAFIFFWLFLLNRIGGVLNGYGFEEVMFLWAVTAGGFGLMSAIFRSCMGLSRAIYQGELDVFLLQPKPVLFQYLISKSQVSGWGDVLYGLLLYVFTQPVSVPGLGLFLLFVILAAFGFTAVSVIYHSLSFWFGRAEGIAHVAVEAMINFSIYPEALFKGFVRTAIMTVVPTFWLVALPGEVMRSFDGMMLLGIVAVDALLCLVAVGVFYAGLRQYESGNRMGARV